jgi:hypothetical protein
MKVIAGDQQLAGNIHLGPMKAELNPCFHGFT